jgi:hypothetical protein
MGLFFIDTSSGQIATAPQLVEGDVMEAGETPPRPWLQIQGTRDATTLWYAVLRRRMRGIFIGTLVIRHSDHYASLLSQGWEEVPVDQIGIDGSRDIASPDARQARSPGPGQPFS